MTAIWAGTNITLDQFSKIWTIALLTKFTYYRKQKEFVNKLTNNNIALQKKKWGRCLNCTQILHNDKPQEWKVHGEQRDAIRKISGLFLNNELIRIVRTEGPLWQFLCPGWASVMVDPWAIHSNRRKISHCLASLWWQQTPIFWNICKSLTIDSRTEFKPRQAVLTVHHGPTWGKKPFRKWFEKCHGFCKECWEWLLWTRAKNSALASPSPRALVSCASLPAPYSRPGFISHLDLFTMDCPWW